MITPSFSLTATERVLPRLALDWTTGIAQSGVDVTRAGVATYIDSNGVLQDASVNTQRVDYSSGTAGLLIEESRVNSLLNNTGAGAVVGSPGTLPTNWAITTSGLSREVVSIGTESGVDYVDLRIFGTTTATSPFISFQSSSAITAAQNEQWSFSSWLKIVAGSTANISNIIFLMQERTAAGGFLASQLGSSLPVDSSLTRFFHTFTVSNASTERIQPLLRFSASVGAVIDLTIRIGLFQVEKGAFATSALRTSGSAVTRNADVATITGTNFSDWFNATEGTFASRFIFGNDKISTRVAVASDNTINNYLGVIGSTGGGTGPYFGIGAGGVTQTTVPSPGAFTENTEYSVCGAYKANDCVGAKDGGAVAVDATATIPTVDRLELGSIAGTSFLNGHILQVQYWPMRLINNEVRAFSK